ncbi:MAG: HD domain-containing protein [Pseudomonadota bacterium]
MEYVTWTRMEDGTVEDYALLERCEQSFNDGLVDRLIAQLRAMDVDYGGLRVTRYVHSLQSATLAERDGADDEMIAAALLHDIGDIIAPYNHSDLAAAVLKPYVSERVHWIVKHHGLFQGYYFHHHLGGDRHARDRFKDHPWYEDCAYFCHNYDQNAFDPDYDTLPLEHFEPLLRRVFAESKYQHLEVEAAE